MTNQLWLILRTLTAGLLIAACPAIAANWNLSAPTSVLIDSTTVPFFELSGVTYVGPSTVANHHRFVAVQDEGGKLIALDVELSPAGALISARSTASLSLAVSLDFEGVAYTNTTRDSAFVAEEDSPGVREYDLATGAELQSVAIPSVFANRRSNFGFESLTRSLDGNTMWTGNEEALAVDGPLATASAGTTVRLLRMNVSGNDVAAAQQYAYQVAPIHASGLASQRRSGLSDLVTLRDGTLLALERSFEVSLSTSQVYRSSVYEIDFTGATDISVAPFSAGLIGQSYTPVTKELLWSGNAAGANGQNLEGLALGPRLPNGNWLLVGVVDDPSGDSDPWSLNTLVAFELSPNPTPDFDVDGDVDGRDFLAWQRGFGTSIGAILSNGDADRDGDVDTEDLAVWSAAYGSASAAATMVPEPAAISAIVLASLAGIVGRRSRYIVSVA